MTGRGGRAGTRPPYVRHTTEGATCTHCGIKNHTAAQCWTLHEDLRPVRFEKINMANLREDTIAANRRWEAEQLAREEKSRQYEQERDARALKKEMDDDENEPRYQFMVYTRQNRSESPNRDDSQLLDDPAQEAEVN